jgi:hypothetical protein
MAAIAWASTAKAQATANGELGFELPEEVRKQLSHSDAFASDAVTLDPAGTKNRIADPQALGPRWSVNAGAIFLDRSDPFPLQIIGGDGLDFDADDFGFDTEAGFLIDASYALSPSWHFAPRYFGISQWTSQKELNPLGPGIVGMRTHEPFVRVNGFADVTVSYGSELHNLEFNLKRKHDYGFSPFIGLRWLNLEEEYTALGSNGDTTAPNAEPDLVAFRIHNVTSNHLLGTQFGLELQSGDPCSPLRAEGSANAGLYYNGINVEVTDRYLIENAGGGVVGLIGRAGEDKAKLAFLGELSVGMAWQARQWLTLRGGYELLWIEGIALAPEQLTGPNLCSGAFYHGPYATIQATW